MFEWDVFCFDVNVAWIIASACGNIIAAAAPWKMWIMINVKELGDKAHPADVKVNIVIPIMNMRFLP